MARQRIFSREGLIQTPPLTERDYSAFESHTKGRIEAVTEIMINVAYLRSQAYFPREATISHSGAAYQDYPGESWWTARAHRSPCNPTISNRSLPQLVSPSAHGLVRLITEPLEATDLVPWLVNVADSRFEESGTYEAMVSAVRTIRDEQKAGSPVDAELIHNVVHGNLIPSFVIAFEAARGRMSRQVAAGDRIFVDHLDVDWSNYDAAARQVGGDYERQIQQAFETGADPDVLIYDSMELELILRRGAYITARYDPVAAQPDQVERRARLLQQADAS